MWRMKKFVVMVLLISFNDTVDARFYFSFIGYTLNNVMQYFEMANFFRIQYENDAFHSTHLSYIVK